MRNLLSLCLTVVLAACAGCASSDKVVQAVPAPGNVTCSNSLLAASARVWVLVPKLTFERVENESALDPSAYRGPEVAKVLTDSGLAALKSKGIGDARTVVESNVQAELKAQAEQASASAQRLFLPTPDRQVLQAIQKLGGADKGVAVLVQYTRVKVGPGGWFDPVLSGDYRTSASSTHLRAALVNCQNGGILWQNSVLLREVPRAESPELTKALQQLYSTLNIKP
jgi:hypothetical protein